MTTKPKDLLTWTQQQDARFGSPLNWYAAIRPDGIEVGQVRAPYQDADGDHELKSDIYEIVRAADATPVNANDFINPLREQQAREMAAAVARSHLTDRQKSPSDMDSLSRSLSNDALYRTRRWEREVEQQLERKAKSDQAIDFLLQIDWQFVTGEQHDKLLKLLGKILQP